MRGKQLLTVVLLVGALVLMSACASLAQKTAPPTTPPTPGVTTMNPPPCDMEDGWGSYSQQFSREAVRSPITAVQANAQACFDRVVIQLQGTVKPAYTVRYGPTVSSMHGDNPVCDVDTPTMEVMVSAPAPYLVIYPTDVLIEDAVVRGWTALKKVCYAGTLNNHTTFVILTTGEQPFHVTVQQNKATKTSRLIIDIARP